MATTYFLPFILLLVAYLVLGPLHYLIEINWISAKEYFVDDNRWPPLAIFLYLTCPDCHSAPIDWETGQGLSIVFFQHDRFFSA